MKDPEEKSGPVKYVKVLFQQVESSKANADVLIQEPFVVIAKKMGNAISIDCPACHHHLFVTDASNNKVIRCPKCGALGIIGHFNSSK